MDLFQIHVHTYVSYLSTDTDVCPLPTILNGNVVTIPPGGSYEIGTFIRYSCNKEYDLKGPSIRECTREVEWSGTNPQCGEKNY